MSVGMRAIITIARQVKKAASPFLPYAAFASRIEYSALTEIGRGFSFEKNRKGAAVYDGKTKKIL